MGTRKYKAIVIGSGISGGWAAKEFCEKGVETLMLERGRNVEHGKDYPTANKAPWELEHANELTQEELKNTPFKKKLGNLNEIVIISTYQIKNKNTNRKNLLFG